MDLTFKSFILIFCFQYVCVSHEKSQFNMTAKPVVDDAQDVVDVCGLVGASQYIVDVCGLVGVTQDIVDMYGLVGASQYIVDICGLVGAS